MDTILLYALALLGCLALNLRVLSKFYPRSWVAAYQRQRASSGGEQAWSHVDTILVVSLCTANVVVILYRGLNMPTFLSRTARSALVNLIAAIVTGRPNVLLHQCDFTSRSVALLHRSLATLGLIEAVAHGVFILYADPVAQARVEAVAGYIACCCVAAFLLQWGISRSFQNADRHYVAAHVVLVLLYVVSAWVHCRASTASHLLLAALLLWLLVIDAARAISVLLYNGAGGSGPYSDLALRQWTDETSFALAEIKLKRRLRMTAGQIGYILLPKLKRGPFDWHAFQITWWDEETKTVTMVMHNVRDIVMKIGEPGSVDEEGHSASRKITGIPVLFDGPYGNAIQVRPGVLILFAADAGIMYAMSYVKAFPQHLSLLKVLWEVTIWDKGLLEAMLDVFKRETLVSAQSSFDFRMYFNFPTSREQSVIEAYAQASPEDFNIAAELTLEASDKPITVILMPVPHEAKLFESMSEGMRFTAQPSFMRLTTSLETMREPTPRPTSDARHMTVPLARGKAHVTVFLAFSWANSFRAFSLYDAV